MALIPSKFSIGQLGVNYSAASGNEVINPFFVDVTAAQMVVGNIFELGILPGGHTIASATLICDDLDTNGTPLVALDVGILTGTPNDQVNVRTMGAEIFAADISARTGVVANATLPSAFKILPTENDRAIGVKVQAAPATAVPGRIRVLLRMYPASGSTQF